MKQQFSFEYTHYESGAALSEADRALVEAAREATQKAHAPYSHFHVGAAARLKSGRILTGSNIESEISIGCTRYQLFCAGKEILCIDRLSQICRINGVDYYSKIASLL